MKRLIVAALLIAGCTTQSNTNPGGAGDPGDITTWHDTKHQVTCWLSHVAYGYRDISCLPDKDVVAP